MTTGELCEALKEMQDGVWFQLPRAKDAEPDMTADYGELGYQTEGYYTRPKKQPKRET